MDFNTFLNQAWADHGKDSAGVARRLKEGAALINHSAQIGQLAHLATHVLGEHLGQWVEGERHLNELLKHKNLDDEGRQAIARSQATLRLSADGKSIPENMPKSDQARVMAAAASARMSHGHLESAVHLLNAARLLCNDLPKDDPAQKSLAATANNLSCALEEKSGRTAGETELMLFAARLALVQWSLVGGWRQVQAAHYRMSKSAFQAQRPEEAYTHALTCLQINEANGGGDFEFFSAHECLANAELARGNKPGFLRSLAECEKHLARLSSEDQQWVTSDMANLKRLEAEA